MEEFNFHVINLSIFSYSFHNEVCFIAMTEENICVLRFLW